MEKFSRILVFMFLATALSNCSPAKFDRLPGEKMEVIPPEVQGIYDVKLNFLESGTQDTFRIQITDNAIKQITRLGVEENKINEQFYCYRLNSYILIGIPDATIKSLWNIAVLEPTPNELKVYYILQEKANPSHPSRILPYLSDREIPLNHEPIMPAPDPKGGMVTPPIGGDAGSLTTLKYTMMNDDQFVNYFERELKGKEFILLKKLKPTDKKGKKK